MMEKRGRRHEAARSAPVLATILGAAFFPAIAHAAAAPSAADRKPVPCGASLTFPDLAQLKSPPARKPYRIEISVPSLANPYIIGLLYGAFAAAKESGVKLSVDSGEGFMDPASQVRQIENAMSRGADALLVNPADPDALVATIDEIVGRGIPTFDVGTASHSTKSYKLVQDDYTQGVTAATLLAQLLPRGGQGIVQGGPANAAWARRRVAGFMDGVKASPQIKVSSVTNQDINPTEGLAKFQNAVQVHPRVDWIYATFNILLPPSSVPPEFRQALYIGGAYDSVMARALRDGSARAALPDLPIAVGYLGVAQAVRKLNGERLPATTCLPSPVVTRENLDDPLWARFNLVPPGWKVPSR